MRFRGDSVLGMCRGSTGVEGILDYVLVLVLDTGYEGTLANFWNQISQIKTKLVKGARDPRVGASFKTSLGRQPTHFYLSILF
jgi:hypothetical protein